MKRIILLGLALSGVVCSFGQKNFGIKIYQNTDFFETQYYNSGLNRRTKVDNVNFSRFSLALDMETKKGYTHEIELMIPELSKSLDNIQFPMNYKFREAEWLDGEATSYSLRYELSKTLTNKVKRFGFNLGLGINPYYVHVEYIPNIENAYHLSNKLYGFAVNAIPRVTYKLSPRFRLDLNVPLKIYDLRGEKTRIKNPNIPLRQQETTEHSNIFFESAYTIRLGIMYKLNK
ncbi:hypothetical protein [Chryseolinea soli]|uniref:Outer membrane protein beta-barrel domain-containing protein n=1 Tax=Chryseolinea soli TaxID=2321403 RepID=A0A385SN81_9BACT|nr:hypothetical protein [Chryseolinea soli]AYB30910.1 hypothetical protein D4L85_10110 [Chryseolinea soli]